MEGEQVRKKRGGKEEQVNRTEGGVDRRQESGTSQPGTAWRLQQGEA